jgi:hypothetical protein
MKCIRFWVGCCKSEWIECAPHYLPTFHYMQKYVVQRHEAQESLSYRVSVINRAVILRKLRVRLSLSLLL